MGSGDGNPDTLFLISEKEGQLNEMYATNVNHTSTDIERRSAVTRCKMLEKELRNAKDFNNRALGERLKRVERQDSVHKQLKQSKDLANQIETRLRSLSASSMSLSSASSHGSVAAMTTLAHSGRSVSCEVTSGQQVSSQRQSFTRRNNSMTKLQAQVVRRSIRSRPLVDKGGCRVAMSKIGSSSSANSDSAFSSPGPSSTGEPSSLESTPQTPPYDGNDRNPFAIRGRACTTTTTALPGSTLSISSGGSHSTSLTSSKSSLISRGSSINSLGVIDEATPTPSILSTARLSSPETWDRASLNGEVVEPTDARTRPKLPDYHELTKEPRKYSTPGYRLNGSPNYMKEILM
uniref:WWC1-like helical hairpin domain-containing protein n=1 Tax=Ciona savignyi TaxID=51511 RepID=H2ZEU1_CIOSA